MRISGYVSPNGTCEIRETVTVRETVLGAFLGSVASNVHARVITSAPVTVAGNPAYAITVGWS